MSIPNADQVLASALTAAEANVHAAYAKLAAHVGEKFKLRASQVDLSIQVAFTMLGAEKKNILLSEAPTGTGKTLAYLIGSIAAKASAPEGHPLKTNSIIIGTATKALQQQVLANDAPTLVACGIITQQEVALAKGRSNYICMRDASEMADKLAQSVFELDEFLPEGLDSVSASDVHAMVDAYERVEWDGDFDQFQGVMSPGLRMLGANADTCVRNRCAYKDNCAFFKARDKLTVAKVIVTNHDIVLLDAKKLAAFEEPSLPIGKLQLVLDEAHHLGAKVMDVCSSELQVVLTQKILPRKAAILKLLPKDAVLSRYVAAKHIDTYCLSNMDAEQLLESLRIFLTQWPMPDDATTARFRSVAVPAELRELMAHLSHKLAPIARTLDGLVSAAKTVEEPDTNGAKEVRKEIRLRCFELLKLVNGAIESCQHYAAQERMARWVYRRGDAVSLHASPVTQGPYLERLLWGNSSVTSVSMVSATLRDLGSYEGVRDSFQLPNARTRELTLPYSFPYGESQLVVVGMQYSPKYAERVSYQAELLKKCPERIEKGEATLILTPSWSMVRSLAPELRRRFGETAVKVQGESSIRALLAAHKRDVDAGQTSIILGTSTLAEGMDLPGKYCVHVMITSLPFAVPTSPLEEEIQEILGRDYFGRRSLPEAMRKLMQMVGRLLRQESDRGKVTIFDNRLGNTSYGRQMLQNLPPFELLVEPVLET